MRLLYDTSLIIKIFLISSCILLFFRKLNLKRYTLSIIFLLIFSFSFLITPFCTSLSNYNLQLFSYFVLMFLGAIWVYCCTGDNLNISLERYRKVDLYILLGLFLVINFNVMKSDIYYGGDEKYHIGTIIIGGKYLVLTFRNILFFILNNKFVFLILICFPFFIFTIVRKKYLFTLFLVYYLCLIFGFLGREALNFIDGKEAFIRYPFLSKWISIFMMPGYGDFIMEEANYRLLPFLSSIGLGCLVYANVKQFHRIIKLLFTFLIITTPLILYYSTILYLEMLFVLFLTIALFDIESLIKDNFNIINKKFSWYSLLMIGFVKETALLFILTFLTFRIAYRIACNKFSSHKIINWIIEESKVIISLLLPLSIFLFFRKFFGVTRWYSMSFSNLFHFEYYINFFEGLFGQILPCLLFFVMSIIILIKKRKFLFVSFLNAVIFSYFLFILLECPPDSPTPYTGYSRFSLFFVPSLIVGSVLYFNSIYKKKMLVFFTIIILLSYNIILSPISLIGHRYWRYKSTGGKVFDRRYPYKEVFSWVKETYGKPVILFSGITLNWWSPNFYFDKIQWHPDYYIKFCPKLWPNKRKCDIKEIVSYAKNNKINIILHFTRYAERDVSKFMLFGYHFRKVFSEDGVDKVIIFEPKDSK